MLWNLLAQKITTGRIFVSVVASFLPLLFPFSSAIAAVITSDTVWQNEVTVTDDILVPPGVTLTVRPGTVVRVSPAESTKTDPEFISALTEITIRGILKVEGSMEAPVSFLSSESDKKGEWAGILIDGGAADIKNCSISGADSALYSINGFLNAANLVLSGNRHGMTIIGDAGKTGIKGSSINGNDYGIIILSSADPVLAGTTVTGNRKKDLWKEDLPAPAESRSKDGITPPLARSYGDEALVGDTVWRGRIRINGNLRIPDGSRLLVTPGTVIEFSRKDTNGDGLGENGILIQGSIVAKGTRQSPIVFRSAESGAKPGDWDSVNLMNSDKAENLIEHCIFEDAYRGLHFHYSTVKVSGSRFSGNYRGVQFQESSVEIVDSDFTSNKSAVQGRDSVVRFTGNRLNGNHQGVNFFRNNLVFSGNRASGSLKEAVRIREGNASVTRNIIIANRLGMMFADIYYGSITGNLVANSGETGLALRNVDNLEISGNYLGRNGSNGLNLQDSRAEIKGNLIAFNAERGIGVLSFSGNITANNLIGNGLYAIDLESSEDIDAAGNWWGGDKPSSVVFDRLKAPSRGRVVAGTVSGSPVPFVWPVEELAGKLTLAGDIIINGHPAVPQGSALTLHPGSSIRFSDGAGLNVKGRLTSEGTAEKPVLFTSLSEKKQGAWDEIVLEQALDSSFKYSVIEYGTWGIHGHFTNLLLDHVLVRHNNGGMRFRSGPVKVRQSVFRDNGIGIRSYIGNGVFEENEITGNEIGLFVRERGGGLTIRKNNFFGNSDYNIRSGDFNSEDIPATENWWGSATPAATIYDGRIEEGIGKVLFEPFLEKPVGLENAGVR
jgi:parallel beta-helix repeat protein